MSVARVIVLTVIKVGNLYGARGTPSHKTRLQIRKVGDRYIAAAKRPSEQIDWETTVPMELEPLIEKLLQLGFNYRDIQDIITEAEDRGEGHMGTG